MSLRLPILRDRGLSDSLRKLRIALVGARNVGKSSITQRFTQRSFGESTKKKTEKHTKRIGDFFVEISEYLVDEISHFQMSSADAFILVYSVDNTESFDCLSDLRDVIISVKGENVPIVVAGNKSELTMRKVHSIMADCVVTMDWENPHFEVSAKTNHNITQLFRKVLEHPSFKKISDEDEMGHEMTAYLSRRRSSLAMSLKRCNTASKQVKIKVPTVEEDGDFEIPKSNNHPRRGLKSRLLNFFSFRSNTM